MRAGSLARKRVQRGQQHGLRGRSTDGAREKAQRLEEFFGAAIVFHDEQDGAAQLGRCQRRDQGLHRIGHAGQQPRGRAAAQGIERVVHRRMTRQASEIFCDGGKKHL